MQLNDKFGLPPVGLPPKKWFGLSDPDLIQTRHKMLSVYINDCLKRPVLIHSRELQTFVEMPEDVSPPHTATSTEPPESDH
jgi:hypothetical protein